MRETAQEALSYFQGNPVLYVAIALVAGFAASKTVAYERKVSFFLCAAVGLIGSFLGQYAILAFGLKDVINHLPEFRFLFDFIAAYIGAFVLAAIIHFIKPL